MNWRPPLLIFTLVVAASFALVFFRQTSVEVAEEPAGSADHSAELAAAEGEGSGSQGEGIGGNIEIGDGMVGLIDASGTIVAILFSHGEHGSYNDRVEWLITDQASVDEFGDFAALTPVRITHVPGFQGDDHQTNDPAHDVDDLVEQAEACLGHTVPDPDDCTDPPLEFKFSKCNETATATDVWRISFTADSDNTSPGQWDLAWTSGMIGRAYAFYIGTDIEGVTVMRYKPSTGEIQYFGVRDRYETAARFPFRPENGCLGDLDTGLTTLWDDTQSAIGTYVTTNVISSPQHRYHETTVGEVEECVEGFGGWTCP